MTRILLTGATSGIGKEAALQLTRQGASLILACRDAGRGQATAAWIAAETGKAAPDVLALDTSSQQSIRSFAADFKRRYDRLDVLINNAGVSSPARRSSVDGIELTLATNVLGYHLLTRELLDLLKSTGTARIVNVASEWAGELDIDDLQFKRRPYVGATAYRQSKQANRMLTWALARRLAGSSVTANAYSPGLVWTGLYRDLTGLRRLQLRVISMLFGHSAQEGAEGLTNLALAPEHAGTRDKFFEVRKDVPCQFRNPELEERLWAICDDLVAAKAETQRAVPA
jgi:NAD(P)-dependent dehydrogenase (short-subunit alcohol dehydrogenase family)